MSEPPPPPRARLTALAVAAVTAGVANVAIYLLLAEAFHLNQVLSSAISMGIGVSVGFFVASWVGQSPQRG